MQDEIALAVVNELKLTLLDKGLRARSTTTSLEAYNLYLQGRHFSNQATERSSAKAAELYAKALAIDPKYAEAWAELAAIQSYSAAMAFGLTSQTAGYNKARASAQRALELDPNLARAHFVLGVIQYNSDWDWGKADVSLKKAMALDPNSADTLMTAGALSLSLGAHDVAVELCKKAVALDPLAAISRNAAAWTYWMSNRPDDAEHEIRALLELSPEVTSGWVLLGLIMVQKGEPRRALEIMNSESAEAFRLYGQAVAYHALGKKEESDAALSALIREYANVAAYQVANIYAYRGDRKNAFDWLDRAYRQRDSGMINFNSDPFLATMADDPRYGAMLRKLKLPRLPQVSSSSPITRLS